MNREGDVLGMRSEKSQRMGIKREEACKRGRGEWGFLEVCGYCLLVCILFGKV